MGGVEAVQKLIESVHGLKYIHVSRAGCNLLPIACLTRYSASLHVLELTTVSHASNEDFSNPHRHRILTLADLESLVASSTRLELLSISIVAFDIAPLSTFEVPVITPANSDTLFKSLVRKHPMSTRV